MALELPTVGDMMRSLMVALLVVAGAASLPAQKPEAGLSTHVLDVTRGIPGRGVVVRLYRMTGETGTLVRTDTTNADGRVGQLLGPAEMKTGTYQIVFGIGDYFSQADAGQTGSPTMAARPAMPTKPAGPDATPFLDMVVVRFGIGNAAQHYHVPITVTPYFYSTYRGS